MSLSEVVNCAPFRLGAPRPLTDFEWAVVQTALARAMDRVQFGLGRTYEPAQLVAAMKSQPCQAWRTSQFGPAPAVATYWVRCFGAWYAGFDPFTRTKLRADVAGGLLCSASPPWLGCKPEGIGSGPADLWEGGPQIVDPSLGLPSTEPCAFYRDRTVYSPMTGRDLVKMMEFLGPTGQIPPNMMGMANAAPALFLDREFLLGIQVKKSIGDPTALPADIPGAALAVLEEAALIWGPGKGASLLELFQGPIDPAKLTALLAKMAPDMMGNFGALTAALPGLLQTAATSPELAQVFGTATQLMSGLFGGGLKGLGAIVQSAPGQPGTKPYTGLVLIDRTRSQLEATPTSAPPLPSASTQASAASVPAASSTSATVALAWIGVAAAAALVVWVATRRS